MMSQNIGELAKALSVAQSQIKPAIKESENPFFRSKYADLASVWDVCREPLSKNGLSVSQLISDGDDVVTVVTLLMHVSGQWLESELSLVPKDKTPQGVGSAITYARRYALSAIVGVSTEDDDDGNRASGNLPSGSHKPEVVKAKKTLEEYRAIASSFKSKQTLKDWFNINQKEAMRDLQKDSLNIFVNHCKKLMSQLPEKDKPFEYYVELAKDRLSWTEKELSGYIQEVYGLSFDELNSHQLTTVENYLKQNA